MSELSVSTLETTLAFGVALIVLSLLGTFGGF